MKNNCIIYLLVIILVSSCNPKMDADTYARYREKGDEVTNQSQATLLANVGKAIQEGGPEYAIEFCNLKATPLIDSLNLMNDCIISRVSEKNRNPQNVLKTQEDKLVWKIFESSNQPDTVLQIGKKAVYYKRIHTVLPACLKCHGNPGTDINEATMEKLQSLYPKDLATGYSLNDFRGLWKVEFKLN